MKMIEILAETDVEEKTPKGEMCISCGICAAVRGEGRADRERESLKGGPGRDSFPGKETGFVDSGYVNGKSGFP
jgi:hypothetical protein